MMYRKVIPLQRILQVVGNFFFVSKGVFLAGLIVICGCMNFRWSRWDLAGDCIHRMLVRHNGSSMDTLVVWMEYVRSDIFADDVQHWWKELAMAERL